MKHLVMLVMCIPFLVNAQGLRFESNLSWNELMSKAKTENKYVFVDCYASWSKSCKWMSENIFPKKEVGDYFNDRFISVAIQMDENSKDAQAVKDRYKEAKNIATTYSVSTYPTFLIFTPKGNIIHRFVGMSQSSEEFIPNVSNSFSSDRQYYTLLEKWKGHKTDSIFLGNVIAKALETGDVKNAETIGNHYISTLKNPFTKEILKAISEFTKSSSDKGFTLFMKNSSLINKIMNDNTFVERKIANEIITTEEIDPLFENRKKPLIWEKVKNDLLKKYPSLTAEAFNFLYANFEGNIRALEIKKPLYQNNAPDDWVGIAKRIKEQFPGYDPTRVIAREKFRYYYFKKKYDESGRTVIDYLEKYGTLLPYNEINNNVWDYVFMNCDDSASLAAAVKWSKYVIDAKPTDYIDIDTYANLLYKSGNVKEGIIWEKKAIDLIESGKINDPKTLAAYKIVLNKMANGEKTWGE